jgi:hypothetical protein
MPDAELGEVPEKPKNFQEPQNHSNDNDAVQDCFDLALHGDEAIDQPQQDSDYGKGKYDVDKRHMKPSWIFCETDWNSNGFHARCGWLRMEMSVGAT